MGRDRTVRVLVFAKGDKEREAREAGADFAGSDDLVAKVSEGFLDFDRVIATPDMMGSVGKLGRVLGPRGLMPNPKVGTVTFDVSARRSGRQGRQDRVPRREGGHRARSNRQGLVHRERADGQREGAHRCPRPPEALDRQGQLSAEHHRQFDHGPRHQNRPRAVHRRAKRRRPWSDRSKTRRSARSRADSTR